MKCRACGHEHSYALRCEQAAALRGIGGVHLPELPKVVSRPKVQKPVPSGAVVVSKTANRRTREAFNAYQRVYMRKYRARKK